MKFWKTFFACLLAVVASSMVMWILLVMIIGGMSVMMTSTTATQVLPKSVLQLDLGRVSDKPVASPWSQLDPNTLEIIPAQSTLQVLETLSTAAVDSNIEGIYLRLGEFTSVSGAACEEIRGALAEFKASGKWIVAYEEVYSQVGYWLATVADRVYVNPVGGVTWTGMASNVMFYKGLLDKLDVKPQIVRHGTFKAAVEPFMTDRMSEANRTQNQTLVNSIWEVLVADVAESRGLTPHYLQLLADRLTIDTPQAALEYGLVDGLMYEPQVMEQMAQIIENPEILAPKQTAEITPDQEVEITVPTADGESVEVALTEVKADTTEVAKVQKPTEVQIISFADYCTLKPVTAKHISRNKIAVIYAEGDILSGSAAQDVCDKAFIKLVRKAREDKAVKAVVLRINSPGGSALAAEQMWYELEQLRAEKPLIVSMGGVAASGGYYIAAPADVIFADRVTVTGSIGVFGLFFNMGDALRNKLGVTVDGAKTSSHADIGSPYHSMDAAERAYFQKSVEDVYVTFVNRVAAGRNMSFQSVDAVGEGRVWSGVDARNIGLVDEFGGLAAAINIAADRAGVADDFRVVEITDELTGLMQLFNNASASVRERVMRDQLGVLYEPWMQMRSLESRQGIRAEMMYNPSISIGD